MSTPQPLVRPGTFQAMEQLRKQAQAIQDLCVKSVTNGEARGLRTALEEGASLFGADADGTPLVVLAAKKENASVLLGCFFDADPSLSLMSDPSVRGRRSWLLVGHEGSLSLGDTVPPKLEEFVQQASLYVGLLRRKNPKGLSFSRFVELEHKLAAAAREGDMRKLQEALAQGASPLAFDADRQPAIVLAAQHSNHKQLVPLFYAADPTIHLGQGTAFSRTEWFLEGADGQTPPHSIEKSPPPGTLRAHQITMDRLAKLYEANRAYLKRKPGNSATGDLRWPDPQNFVETFVEHFEESLAQLEASA